MKTMDEFKQLGTDLTEKHHSHHEYEGHPRPYNSQFQEERKPVDVNPKEHDGTHDPEKTGHFGSSATGTGAGLTSGTTSSNLTSGTGVGGGTTGTGLESSREEAATSGHGNSAAMGSGVAGVAAGAAAQDLGRDHTRAGQNTDLSPRDTTGPVGDSGVDTAGTSLGGRAGGNTVSGATDAVSGNTTSDATHETSNVGLGGRRASRHEMEPVDKGTTDSAAETTPSRVGETKEPENLEGGPAEPKSRIEGDDSVQHASQLGEDPSLVTSNEVKSGKLTGTGIDGSHSAVFGLTPDGHKFNDTKSAADNIESSAKDTSNKRDSGVGEENLTSDEGTTSKGPGTGEVAEQMNDPRVAEKGHEGKANYGESDNKPGAGV